MDKLVDCHRKSLQNPTPIRYEYVPSENILYIGDKACPVYHDNDECAQLNLCIRRRRYKDGSFSFHCQCANCGKCVTEAIEKRLVKKLGIETPDFDDDAHKNYEDRVKQKQQQKKEYHDELWQQRYNAYLSDPNSRWRTFVRPNVLRRDGKICQGCFGSGIPVDVHHLTYARVFEELLFDCITLCVECHAKVHPDKQDLKARILSYMAGLR